MKHRVDELEILFTLVAWIGYAIIAISVATMSWELFGIGVLVSLIATGFCEVL